MAKKKTKKVVVKKLTANNLQESLWDTFNQLKAGNIAPGIANAMARQSGEICKIEKLKLDQERLDMKRNKKRRQKLLK